MASSPRHAMVQTGYPKFQHTTHTTIQIAAEKKQTADFAYD